MIKKLFDKGEYTEDKDCALLPPELYTGKEANNDYFCIGKRSWQSAPTVAITKGGRLFCSFSGDNSETSDECPNNYNVLVYSDDAGNTWTDNVLVIDHSDSVRIHEPNLYVADDGALWVFWDQSYIWWDSRGGVWATVCNNPDDKDGIFVWSKPRRLCDGVFVCQPIITSKGEMMIPVSVWKNFPRHTFNHLPDLEYSSVYVSNDGGKTFKLRGHADDKFTTFDENCLVERNDGSFVMIMREEKAIGISFSYDDAKTWSEPRQLMPHISSRSFLSKFSNGDLVLVTNDPEGIANGRCMMTAFVSKDGGESFPYKMLLYKDGTVSYPGGMVTKDDRVYVAFDRNRYSDGEIYLSFFTEEDILAGHCVTEGSYPAKLIIKSGKDAGKQKAYDDGGTY